MSNPYNNLRGAARVYVEQYLRNRGTNGNAQLITNVKKYLNAVAAANGAKKAGANNNVQAAAALGAAQSPANNPVENGMNAAAAVLAAGGTANQANGAANAAAQSAAAPPPPPPPLPPRPLRQAPPPVNKPKPAVSNSENPIARAAANMASRSKAAKIAQLIKNLNSNNQTTRGQARAALGMYNRPNSNINNNTRKSIKNALAEIRIPKAAAPAGNAINMRAPNKAHYTGQKMKNGKYIYANSPNGKNYYARKNNSTNNYYKLKPSMNGGYNYNGNVAYVWSNNKFTRKIGNSGNAFGGLAQKAAEGLLSNSNSNNIPSKN
jgi:hypothetical protein